MGEFSGGSAYREIGKCPDETVFWWTAINLRKCLNLPDLKLALLQFALRYVTDVSTVVQTLQYLMKIIQNILHSYT